MKTFCSIIYSGKGHGEKQPNAVSEADPILVSVCNIRAVVKICHTLIDVWWGGGAW